MNSAVNERRARRFLPSTSSMMDILSRDKPLILDVRQSESVPRVEVEHREGVALVLLVPYTRSRLRKTVTLGPMTVAIGPTRVWPR